MFIMLVVSSFSMFSGFISHPPFHLILPMQYLKQDEKADIFHIHICLHFHIDSLNSFHLYSISYA